MKHTIRMITAFVCITTCAAQAMAASQKTDWSGVMQNALDAYSGTGKKTNSTLSDAQIAAGLKEALGVGTRNVVSKLGKTGGFNLDPKIRIALPSQLKHVDTALKLVDKNSLTQDLETRMNSAAELATPKAKQLFVNAISHMTFADARTILLGGKQDAATQFFRRTMGADLVSDIQPVIKTTLAQSGAIKAFDTATSSYNTLPMVSRLTGDAKTNLNSYVASKAVDGIFYYVAKEEAAIRQDPAKRTTQLLQQVFGSKQK